MCTPWGGHPGQGLDWSAVQCENRDSRGSGPRWPPVASRPLSLLPGHGLGVWTASKSKWGRSHIGHRGNGGCPGPAGRGMALSILAGLDQEGCRENSAPRRRNHEAHRCRPDRLPLETPRQAGGAVPAPGFRRDSAIHQLFQLYNGLVYSGLGPDPNRGGGSSSHCLRLTDPGWRHVLSTSGRNPAPFAHSGGNSRRKRHPRTLIGRFLLPSPAGTATASPHPR